MQDDPQVVHEIGGSIELEFTVYIIAGGLPPNYTPQFLLLYDGYLVFLLVTHLIQYL